MEQSPHPESLLKDWWSLFCRRMWIRLWSSPAMTRQMSYWGSLMNSTRNINTWNSTWFRKKWGMENFDSFFWQMKLEVEPNSNPLIISVVSNTSNSNAKCHGKMLLDIKATTPWNAGQSVFVLHLWHLDIMCEKLNKTFTALIKMPYIFNNKWVLFFYFKIPLTSHQKLT